MLDELLKIKEEKLPHRRFALDWSRSVNGRPTFGGVYAFWWRGSVQEFISSIQNPNLHFHGPGGKQLTLRIDMSCLRIAQNGRLPLYVGRNATDIAGSLGFRRVTVSESPTCWGRGATNPNKLGTPVRYPRQLPKTHNI